MHLRVFFHVFVCSLLLLYMLKSSALRVGVKTLHSLTAGYEDC